MSWVVDTRERPLRDLRVSVTDRCNLRCRYCMPREVFGPGFEFVPRAELLTFEEITRVVAASARLGVTKVRITGGEPLLRKDLPDLMALLAAVPGVEDLAMTTNGLLLAEAASALREAGVDRLTVSLDALDDATFQTMSDTRRPVSDVLEGIEAAVAAGFPPPKINTVVRRGVNEHSVLELAMYGRETGSTVRFIEYMDVGHSNGWDRREVVPAAELLAAIGERWDIEPVAERDRAPAERYAYVDGAGEVGVVASVTRPFCRTCVRARLSAVGELFTCLFATTGHDLRAVLRSDDGDEELQATLERIWSGRDDRYSEARTAATSDDPDRIEMSYIGG
ncbi:MAG: GTP 3',8-cyclase MoaA [Nitriliruptorales bacterium]|nr:GTP 3',8-cyclase MoaA [Nitriliruptorales bacterium]